MNKHVNLIAYDDFEKLENIDKDIKEYRQAKFDSASQHLNFIRRCFPNKKITVVELGSGNSKTLFALEKEGILKLGYGLEISKSRFKFAEAWKNDWGFRRVKNINADILEINFKKLGKFDLCFCADFTFQLLGPVNAQKPAEILNNIYTNLAPNGKIILELDGFERIISIIKNGNIKFWEEFSFPDPWRFSLWDCKYNWQKKFLAIEKIFIKRNQYGFSKNTTILRVYKRDEICQLLRNAGFKKIKLFSSWRNKNFKNDGSKYIVMGEKIE